MLYGKTNRHRITNRSRSQIGPSQINAGDRVSSSWRIFSYRVMPYIFSHRCTCLKSVYFLLLIAVNTWSKFCCTNYLPITWCQRIRYVLWTWLKILVHEGDIKELSEPWRGWYYPPKVLEQWCWGDGKTGIKIACTARWAQGPAWVSNCIHHKVGRKLLIYNQTWTMQPLKFGNG